MKLTERLEKDNRQKQKRRSPSWDEDEETLTYMERKRPAFINERSHTFDRIGDDSFHVAPSIFDKQAIFHTGGDQ